MCDFRTPPTGMVEEHWVAPVTFRGYVSANKQIAGTKQEEDLPFVTHHPYMHDESIKKEEGVYYVCATGGGYQYFDGEEWVSKELLYQEGDNWCGSILNMENYEAGIEPYEPPIDWTWHPHKQEWSKDLSWRTGAPENELGQGPYSSMLQNLSVSVDLGREEINELGRRGNYFKFVEFPLEITEPIIDLVQGT
jgi:hypothetical protein